MSARKLADLLTQLTEMQRLYVDARIRGMSKVASAAAAGYSRPDKDAARVEDESVVAEAISIGVQHGVKKALITREKLNDMALEAYSLATTSAEMVQAINTLAKLNGLNEPQKVEVTKRLEFVATERDVRSLPIEDLLALADMNQPITLEGEYEYVTDEDDEEDEAAPEALAVDGEEQSDANP